MAESNNAKKRSLKAGDKVRLVTGKLARVEATVEKVHANGKLDLTAEVNGETHTLTGCACDPEAKTTDSWHHAAEDIENAQTDAAIPPAAPKA